MKLTVENFGRIRRAEVEFRPFTVFVGPNNTHKTWLTYLAAEVADPEGLYDPPWYPRRFVRRMDRKAADRIAKGLSDIMRRVEQRPEFHDPFVTETFFEEPSDCRARFGSEGAGYETDNLGSYYLELALEPYGASSPVMSPGFRGEFTVHGSRLYRAAFDGWTVFRSDAAPEMGGNTLHVYQRYRKLMTTIGIPLPMEPAARLAKAEGFVEGATDAFGPIQVFPSERLGLFGVTQSLATLTNEVNRRNLKVEQAGLNRQSMRFLRFVNDVLRRALKAKNVSGASEWYQGDSTAMANIAGGWVEAPTGGIATQFFFRPEGTDQRMVLTRAASLVRSLGALQFGEEARRTPGSILVIDEPELAAHPEAVLKTTEYLAGLAARGTNVFITTHSPYIVEYLAVLMRGRRLAAEARAGLVPKLRLGDAAAFIDPEDVAVYEFREERDGSVTVHDVIDRENGFIGWRTFGKPAEAIDDLAAKIHTASTTPRRRSRRKTAE